MATEPRKAPPPPPRDDDNGVSRPPPTQLRPSLSGEVIIPSAPPLPPAKATEESDTRTAMETGDAEQNAGRMAMEVLNKRLKAEQEAGQAALGRFGSVRAG